MFVPVDISRLSADAGELRAAPTTGWNEDVEKAVMHSMSFSESDMLSHPLILLYAVATTDVDPLQSIQTLSSKSYLPQCFTSVRRLCVAMSLFSVFTRRDCMMWM